MPSFSESDGRWPPSLRRMAGVAAIACFGLLGTACDSGGGPAEESRSEFEGEEYQGLSREEIESQAEAMTLEEAESLGIVDTTIRIQPPMNPDSVVPAPSDTAVPDPD